MDPNNILKQTIHSKESKVRILTAFTTTLQKYFKTEIFNNELIRMKIERNLK